MEGRRKENDGGRTPQTVVEGRMVREGEQARLNQGWSHHHRFQVKSGEGSVGKIPQEMARAEREPKPCNCVYTRMTARIFLKRRYGVITWMTIAVMEGSGKGPSKNGTA